MIDWTLLAAFIVAETILCVAPGPAVLLTLSQAMTEGFRRSLFAVIGIVVGNTLYFVLSATSIGAVFRASTELFWIIRWVGAAYLIWLGIASWRGAGAELQVAQDQRRSVRALILRGFLTQASNPKAILFFAAALPQFIDPVLPIVPQITVLGLASQIIEFAVLSGYAAVAARASAMANGSGFVALTYRLSGGALVAAGCALVFRA
jgi:homoserine/homoserine lactone efflux protein